MKRENYITWDEMFMSIAETAAMRSKDPNTQHGSCIVKNSKVLSVGYNGLVYGLNDNGYPIMSVDKNEMWMVPKEGLIYDYWERSQKDNWCAHSEFNAILNAKCDLKGSTLFLYSTKGYYPCKECAKMIVQCEICEVVMKTAIKTNTDVYNWNFTQHMFKMADIKIRVLNDN